MWPEKTRAKMLEVQSHGMKLAECFEADAMRSLDENEVAEVRELLNLKCRAQGQESKFFDEDSDAAYVLMANQIYDSLENLGAKPDAD
ncbi:hypothetical protein GRI89_09095 [Altererythrobacter salegens]|uniref:Uncharacterized protein n=1 Tax=Croceibacterium salegens TaxID=1737568 RepID=A0A6I4SUC0_9SPHN|nr:hypothetical protein [Croceibacterium salegens]MXO59694.1 hypothetical protein [Croceibacterium salegens]